MPHNRKPYIKPSAKYGIGADHKSRGGSIAKVHGKDAHIDLTDKYIKLVWDTKTADDLIVARGKGTRNVVDGAKNYDFGLTLAIGSLLVAGYGMGSSQGWWGKGKKEKEDREKDLANVKGDLSPMLEQGMFATQEAGREMLGEGGFFDQQLQQQMGKFGVQEKGIEQGGIASRQQAAARSQQAQQQAGVSGITSSGSQQDVQQQMLSGAYAQGGQRQLGRENIQLGREQATTASDIQRTKYTQGMNQQLARMMGDYISATGESVPDDMMKMWEEYTSENTNYG